jgi:tetratricopeptide (TPR) repeat protein
MSVGGPFIRGAFLLAIIVVAIGCNSDDKRDNRVSTSGLGMAETTLLLSAERALSQYRFQYARKLVDSLNGIRPGLPETQFVRARIQAGVGDLDAAEATYATLLRRGFERIGVRQNAGDAAFRQNRFRRALQYFREEQARYPSALPLHGMGMALDRLGQVDSARIAFDQALMLDPGYAPAERSLAAGYEQAGEFDLALIHIEKAIGIDSTNSEFRSVRGLLLSLAGSDEEAVVVLTSVIESEPSNYTAEIALARSLQRLGRGADAESHLEAGEQKRAVMAEIERLRTSVKELPENDRLRIDLAKGLQRVGLYDEAIQHYQILEYRLKQNLTLSGNLATLYMQTGNTEEALRRYNWILSQDSTHVETWLNLGHHHARQGRRQEALEAWGKAATYEPDHPGVKALERMARGN